MQSSTAVRNKERRWWIYKNCFAYFVLTGNMDFYSWILINFGRNHCLSYSLYGVDGSIYIKISLYKDDSRQELTFYGNQWKK